MVVNPLFDKRPRSFGIGGDIQPKRDLCRFVKWPKYFWLQRQKAVLHQRLKVPPPIHLFKQSLNRQKDMIYPTSIDLADIACHS